MSETSRYGRPQSSALACSMNSWSCELSSEGAMSSSDWFCAVVRKRQFRISFISSVFKDDLPISLWEQK